MENVRKFLKVLQTDRQAQKLARTFPPPRNDDEAAESYARLAQALGFRISPEEMAAGMQSLSEETRKHTDSAAKAVGRIGEDELDEVAGGAPGHSGAWYPSYCRELFVEDQWCWYADSCSGMINNYDEVIHELSN